MPQDKESTDPSRVGGAVNHLLSDGGMSTMIAGGRGVDHGLVRNLQRMQARTEITTDRALISAFKEIGKICSAMKLLDIVKKQAEEVYKEAHDNSKSIKGKSQAAVLAAVVFIACRQTGNARSFKEICKVVANASVKASRARGVEGEGGGGGGASGRAHRCSRARVLAPASAWACHACPRLSYPSSNQPSPTPTHLCTQDIGRVYNTIPQPTLTYPHPPSPTPGHWAGVQGHRLRPGPG